MAELVAYPFRYKPQDLNRPPGIYAPLSAALRWNLWFASRVSWREYPIVPNTEVGLLSITRMCCPFLRQSFSAKSHRVRSVRCSA